MGDILKTEIYSEYFLWEKFFNSCISEMKFTMIKYTVNILKPDPLEPDSSYKVVDGNILKGLIDLV